MKKKEHFRKLHFSIIMMLIALFMVAGSVSAAADTQTVASGTYGELLWYLHDDGTLTVGADIESTTRGLVISVGDTQPGWLAPGVKNNVTNLVVDRNSFGWIVAIDAGAFAGFSNLETITIPKEMRTIEYGAFDGCDNIKDVILYTDDDQFGGSGTYADSRNPFGAADMTVYVVEGTAAETYFNALYNDHNGDDYNHFTVKHTCGIDNWSTRKHVYSTEYTVDLEPTCTEPGQKSKHCTKCDAPVRADITEIPALGHNFIEDPTAPDALRSSATCVKQAEYYMSCSRCHELDEDHTFSYGELADHRYRELQSEDALAAGATFKKPALYYESCVVCGDNGPNTFVDRYGRTLTSTSNAVIDETMIPDEKLRTVLTILANYWNENGGLADFYEDVVKNHGDPAKVDITTLDEAQPYKGTLKQEVLEAYPGTINLGPYNNMDLTGITYAKKAKRIVLPYGITEIDSKQFFEMETLAAVDLPDTLRTVKENAFQRCRKLQTIRVYHFVGDNAVYEGDAKRLNLSHVKTIGDYAFASCEAVSAIDLYEGSGGISIGSNAFDSCVRLTAADIPEGTMGTGVFNTCTRMESLRFDDSYKAIPNSTLMNADGSEDGVEIVFPEDLETIGTQAFAGCKIKTTNLADCKSLKTIGEYAFWKTKILGWQCDLSDSKKLKNIGSHAFSNAKFSNGCGAVLLPDTVDNMGISVFFATKGLTSVNIPDSLNGIPAGTFMCSYDLSEVIVHSPSFTFVGEHAFDCCGHLPNTDFLKDNTNLVRIEKYAFARCIPTKEDYESYTEGGLTPFGLKDIDLPYSVSTIGESAFENDFLVTRASLSYFVRSIPKQMLYCEKSSSVKFKDVVLDDAGRTVTYPFSGSQYKDFRDQYSGYGDIYKLSSLHEVYISELTSSIGSSAFYGNTSLEYIHSGSITLGTAKLSNVSSIGESAFAYCANLNDIDLSGNVKELGKSAFMEGTGIQQVTLSETIEEIPESCFAKCENLASIQNMDSVRTIGKEAFLDCAALSSITLGTEPCLETLGESAFKNSGITQFVNFSKTSVADIPDSAFEGCGQLEELICPDSLENIGDKAFKNCQSLRKLEIPMYASLSKSMFAENTQQINLTTNPGRYATARYKVPVGMTIGLPADAFAVCDSKTITQVDSQGNETVLDGHTQPEYFNVIPQGNTLMIEGLKGGEGLRCLISGIVNFTDYDSIPLSAELPIDIIDISAESIVFDDSGFRLDKKTTGKIVQEPGDIPKVYVDAAKKGKTLLLTAEATANVAEAGKHNKGMITDEATWEVLSGDSLTKINGSDTKTPGSEVCKTSAEFTVGNPGTSIVRVNFTDSNGNVRSEGLEVHVINSVKSFDFILESLGAGHPNPDSVILRQHKNDKISCSPVYSDPAGEKTDQFVFTSNNEGLVAVDEEGNLTIGSPDGSETVTITITTLTRSVSRTLTIDVKDVFETIDPSAIDITGPMLNDAQGIAYIGEEATFSASCLPSYSTQGVDWSIDNANAILRESDGKAILTGANVNKTVTLTAHAKAGEASESLTVAVRQKAEELRVLENTPIIVIADKTGNFKMSNSLSQTGGIVRIPDTTLDEVTFTSNDPEKLLLGTGSDNCDSASISLSTTSTTQSKTLYFKGISGGTTTITARARSGAEASISVLVIQNPIKSIDFTLKELGSAYKNPAKIMMPVGEKIDQILPVITYTDPEGEIRDDYLVYESSDPEVAAVTDEGEITAVSAGTAEITAYAASKKSLYKKLTVTVAGEGETVKPYSIEEINGPKTADGKGLVYVGEDSTFKVVCLPSYASDTVDWSVGDTGYVYLDSTSADAVLTGKEANKSVTLKATADTVNGSKYKTLNVVTKQKTTQLRVVKTPPVLEAGATGNFPLSSSSTQKEGVIRIPETSLDDVTFTTEDPSIVMLGTSSSGCTETSVTLSATSLSQSKKLYYKGLKAGEATITARADSGAETSLVITVVADPITALTCTEKSVTLIKGGATKMKLSITPAGSSERLTYKSSKPNVATVDENGIIQAVETGNTTITASSTIRKKSVTCSVKVVGAGQTISVGTTRYKVNADNTLTYTSAPSNVKTLTIPDTALIGGRAYKVTEIADSALSGRSTLKTLIIGENVVKIGKNVCNGCPKLKTVKIKSKVLKKIGKGAFRNIKKGAKFKCPKGKKKQYRKLLKKSGLPKKAKVK